jgi:hypothetical protein
MNLRLAISTFTVLGLMVYTISLLPAGEPNQAAALESELEQIFLGPPALAEPQLLIYRDSVLISTPMEFHEMPDPPEYFEPLIIEFDPESATPNLISESHFKPITQEVQL